MEILIIIILSLMIGCFVYFKVGDYFAPWFITTGVWLAILVMFQFQRGLLYPLSDQFYNCVLIWVPIFCLSSLITYYVLPKVKDETHTSVMRTEINKWLFNAIFIIAVVTTPLYVYQIIKIVTMFDTTDMLFNLRLLAVYGDHDLGFLQYSYIINQSLFVIAIWQYPKVPIWQIIVILIMNLMGQFAIMEKSGVFFLVITTLFVLYEKHVIKVRSIFITFGIIILVFFFINMSKEVKSDNSFESMTFVDFFSIYILSPSVAFGKVTEDLSNQFGSHCFQYVYLFLNRWGIGDYEVNTRLQEFVWVPLPTNVFTIFQPFYEDFQYKGVAFFAFIYGILSGWIYRLFRNGSFIARCIYAYFVRFLIMQFYHEDLIMNIILFIQFVFFVSIISFNSMKISFKKIGNNNAGKISNNNSNI
jgi:oligosaccharide repeat unit polymerase